jgi:hypothetical protein
MRAAGARSEVGPPWTLLPAASGTARAVVSIATRQPARYRKQVADPEGLKINRDPSQTSITKPRNVPRRSPGGFLIPHR